MIITRTPYRISFFGGGTDYPAWYEKNGGAVLSTTINKYSYLTCRHLPPFFNHKHRIVYRQIENVNNIKDIDHPSVRETLKFFKIDKGLEIHHDGDLPAMSGLGSSSSFTVGLVTALNALRGQLKTKREVALNAIHIEQNLIKENVGSQDQTAASFGGFNLIQFGGPRIITVDPVVLSRERIEELESHLMLFSTGLFRKASKIAASQIKTIPKKTEELHAMRAMVDEGISILRSKNSIENFGKLLHESWKLKRGLTSKISNTAIDDIYETGRKAGVIGGKLIGAGGGGFMLLFARPENQERIKIKLKNLLYVPFCFEYLGSQVIYHTGHDE